MAGRFQITLSPAPHNAQETVVHVDHRFPDRAEEGRNPFKLVSSCVDGPRLGDEFDPALTRKIDARLRSRRGRRKGRVLYVLADGDPVAALAYHVPEGEDPVCILGAGAADWVDDELAGGAMLLIAYLLECCVQISERFGRGRRVAWATDSDDTCVYLHGQWKFRALPRWQAPPGIRTRHYLIR